MGRYCYGDIHCKIWGGADRFGSSGIELSNDWLRYNFSLEHLPLITQELSNIESNLGDRFNKLIIFFKEHPDGDNELLCKELDINSFGELVYVLGEYNNYQMGCQIKDCVESYGKCVFEAEP